MPKAYSEKERIIVKNNLKKAAFEQITKQGIRKTTVDGIVKSVNIPKGTFYLFYESKELLFFDAILEEHNKIQDKVIGELSALSDTVTVDELTNCIFKYFQLPDITGMIKLLSDGELELLVRKLPDSVITEHLEHDDKSIEQLIKQLPNAKNKSIESFSAAFRAVFLTLLHKNEIGSELYDNTVYLLIRGLVIQLLS